MERVDCLFLHVPKLRNYYRPIDQFIWINFLPMGLLGLADLLQRHGMSTQIVHMGVEWIENCDPDALWNFSSLDRDPGGVLEIDERGSTDQSVGIKTGRDCSVSNSL